MGSCTTWVLLAFVSVLMVNGSITIDAGNGTNPSFVVDYEQNQFLLDGEPFRYVSGSFHYFRAPRVYWRDRLRKLRAAGLNAVSTYVEWSLHQPKPGQWNWGEEADLEYFLTLAQEEDLFVLLRPGPYICAERDLGGFPVWLLSLVPQIRLRTSDSRYMTHVTTYINELMRRVKPFLRGNGGPVIMVQVENEYGSYGACDLNYMSQVRDLLSHHVQNDALLYTTDGAANQMLRCGMVPEVYTTVDFGASSNVTRSFATMRLFQPRVSIFHSKRIYNPGLRILIEFQLELEFLRHHVMGEVPTDQKYKYSRTSWINLRADYHRGAKPQFFLPKFTQTCDNSDWRCSPEIIRHYIPCNERVCQPGPGRPG